MINFLSGDLENEQKKNEKLRNLLEKYKLIKLKFKY